MSKEPQARYIILNALIWAGVMLAVAGIMSESEHRAGFFVFVIVGWTVSDRLIRRRSGRSSEVKKGC